MANTEQTLGHVMAVVGGVLFLVGAFVALVLGGVDLAVGRPLAGLAAWTETLLLVVFGVLAIVFARLGYRSTEGHPMTAGVMLVVLAAVAAVTLTLAINVIALVAVILVLLAGVLYLIVPFQKATWHPATG